MQKEIKQIWHFHQSPQTVWEYLTKPELIAQWLSETDFKPVVGHKFKFTNSCTAADNKPHYTYCKVLEIIPQKLLSYSWQKGTTENDITLDSIVTWTLTEKNGATELHLEHNGFKFLEDVIAHTNGWNDCLNKITELINASSNANTNA